MCINQFRFLAVGVAVCGALAGAAHGADRATPKAERLRFDASEGVWIELPTPQAGTVDGDLAIARALYADKAYKAARKTIRAWLKDYGESSAHHPAALLLAAQIEKAMRHYDAAYNILSQLLEEFRRSQPAGEAVVEMFNIAEVYLGGVRRKFLGMRLLNATDFAIEILDDIANQYPDAVIAEQALKTKADYFHDKGDFSLAELEYGQLVRAYPNGRYDRYAQRRVADSALASFGGVLFDERPLIEAEERYRSYAARYPGLAEQEGIGLILGEVREKRAAKEFEIGAYYQRTRHPRAAAYYYRSTITNWPDSIAATKAARAKASLAGLERDATIKAIESAGKTDGGEQK